MKWLFPQVERWAFPLKGKRKELASIVSMMASSTVGLLIKARGRLQKIIAKTEMKPKEREKS